MLYASERRCLYTKHTKMLQLSSVFVTTKINVVDTLYAATAVSLNIVDHLACVTNQPYVSTAQVITLQTQSNAHDGKKRRKFSKSNVKIT